MASVFAHALVAYTATKITKPASNTDYTRRLFIFALIWSILPDLDSIGYFLGIPYQHLFGHRGFSHSLFFAFISSFILVNTVFNKSELSTHFQKLKLILFFTIVMSSHAMLDALTTGGLGVAVFAPFDNSRYFFPWRPIEVSPISIQAFFSDWGVRVLISELIWVAIPCLFFLILNTIKPLRK